MYKVLNDDGSPVGIMSVDSLARLMLESGSSLKDVHKHLAISRPPGHTFGFDSFSATRIVANHALVDYTRYTITPLDWRVGGGGSLEAGNYEIIPGTLGGFDVYYCFCDYYDEDVERGFETVEAAQIWAWEDHKTRIARFLTPIKE